MAWLICVKLAVCILMAAFLSLFLWWKFLVFGTFKYILFFILLPHSKYWLCHVSISYQPVIVVAQVQSWVIPCMICGEGSRTGTGFLWVIGWPALVLFPATLHAHSYARVIDTSTSKSTVNIRYWLNVIQHTYECRHLDLLHIAVVLIVIFIHIIHYFVLSSLSEGCTVLYIQHSVLEGSCTVQGYSKWLSGF